MSLSRKSQNTPGSGPYLACGLRMDSVVIMANTQPPPPPPHHAQAVSSDLHLLRGPCVRDSASPGPKSPSAQVHHQGSRPQRVPIGGPGEIAPAGHSKLDSTL
jgi:hypothetical protein